MMANLRSDDGVPKMTAEDKEYAAIYLNETDNNRAQGIEEIRRWITKSDDLCAPTDNFFILRFLRASKFNVDRAKRMIRKHLQQRSDTPEWHANRDSFLPEMQELLNLGVYLTLLKLDHLGRMVVIVRPNLRNPYKQTLSNLMKVSIMLGDVGERYQIPGSLRGLVIIIDIGGFNFGHIVEIRPGLLKKLVHVWQDSYPLRIRSIIFINVPTYVSVGLMLFKGLMNAKMKQRFHVYTHDIENMWSKQFPADILPVEYGGTGCILHELKEYWKKILEENRDWLIYSERYKVISSAK